MVTTEADVREFPLPLKKSTGLRVLVVDDEPLIRWSLAETLTDCGLDVVEAGDGREALQALNDAPRPFDVVMLDYRLPDSNNLDLLSLIRTRSSRSQVVLMTAYGTPEMAEHAVQLGAYCVVHKPLDMQDMVDLVSRAHRSRMGTSVPVLASDARDGSPSSPPCTQCESSATEPIVYMQRHTVDATPWYHCEECGHVFAARDGE